MNFTKFEIFDQSCGPYYKNITIVNYDSSVINKFEASHIGDARVIIYDHHMFKPRATGNNQLGAISQGILTERGVLVQLTSMY